MAPVATDTNKPNGSGDVRNNEGIANYTKFWQKDSKNDSEVDTQNRLTEYTSVVNGYYDGATDLYEYGWGQNFHFARYYPGEAFYQAIARHEHYLAHTMGLKRGMRVLDVGCGVGGPAREIARFAGVNIVGINNNEYQVLRARKYTKKAGLEGQCEFVKGDFMKLAEQFGENSFDAVYAIEATCHAPTWEGVYGEILKVLKPGGRLGLYEWCMTDKWDASVPEHKRIAHGIELGDGIAEMRSIKQARSALNSVGFKIEEEQDLADMGDAIAWYYPLEGDLRKCQTLWDLFQCWRMTKLGTFTTQTAVRVLELARLAPKGTYDVGESLKVAAEALVAGGRAGLFTPMMHFVAQKPSQS
ncbi:putative delta(24)-sterol c-methyltransferase [Tilletiaria anomala UBC 951]|uniref:Sterol 24-C-methyltransferase n=1 Tax=Tilletiaria anomala (strain ATCC 24038 / CBS 436.72 / UBC 951) TaxID=1037660 RepID=A0A066WJQ6_TILAU|nr:putative delta(24)-sterol c-methyltransferase [Tilletiaria anomala UBC 951]KDN50860.1 putative delta(24)-sterol c-methyltransferase [Tilletiaria anomala UBC 951]